MKSPRCYPLIKHVKYGISLLPGKEKTVNKRLSFANGRIDDLMMDWWDSFGFFDGVVFEVKIRLRGLIMS